MSDFDWSPMPEFGIKTTPRVITAQFDEGYSQRSGKGLNPLAQSTDLTFQRIAGDIDSIVAFLESKGGVASFTWTPEGGSEIRVICTAWTRTYVTKNVHQLICTFARVYES